MFSNGVIVSPGLSSPCPRESRPGFVFCGALCFKSAPQQRAVLQRDLNRKENRK